MKKAAETGNDETGIHPFNIDGTSIKVSIQVDYCLKPD
jgi:hypothetical protein